MVNFNSSGRVLEFDEAKLLMGLWVELLRIFSHLVCESVLDQNFLFIRVGCKITSKLEQPRTPSKQNLENYRQSVRLEVIKSEFESYLKLFGGTDITKQVDIGTRLKLLDLGCIQLNSPE